MSQHGSRWLKRCITASLSLLIATTAMSQEADERLKASVPGYWGTSTIIKRSELPGGGSQIGRIPGPTEVSDYEESFWELRLPTALESDAASITLAQFARQILTAQWSLCESLRTSEMSESLEDGVAVLYVQSTCNRLRSRPGKGVITRYKFMKTPKGLYFVTHEFGLRSFDAVKGAQATMLDSRMFHDDAHSKRMLRYLQQSQENLLKNVKICSATSPCAE